MQQRLVIGTAVLLAATLEACVVRPQLAPGAEAVRVTSTPADVQSCKAVGNIDASRYGGDKTIMRNEVIGDGGDTLLLTFPGGTTALGIAYLCGAK